jgi:hypothetical protein
MSWVKLLADNRVTALPSSKAELDNLRSIVVRAAGYRLRAVGGHYNTFVALEAADPAFAGLSAYFDGCRMKRNASEYDFAGGVSDTEAEGLLTAVRQFAADAEAWIAAQYPHLA